MIPWQMGKQLVWAVTVVNALAPSRLNQGSLSNHENTTTDAESRTFEKYQGLFDNSSAWVVTLFTAKYSCTE